MTENWSRQEVDLIIPDYFSMLERELQHQSFNKSAYRKALLPKLPQRNNRSVESKHQNISAVLKEQGIPFIKGYKPLHNYQGLLENQVIQFLETNKARLQPLFEAFPNRPVPASAVLPEKIDFSKCVEPPPAPSKEKSKKRMFKVVKINYLEKEQRNRSLGKEGEQFVIDYEKWRLKKAGKAFLIKKIVWTSENEGDGAGYDILSKNVDGSDRHIEVKTTKLTKDTPIFVTANEVAFAEQNGGSFFLYRVFNAGSGYKLFIMQGGYVQHCRLEPQTYQGVF